MNIIFDCNVLVSAFILKGSVPTECWKKVKDKDLILASKNTLEELKDVFLRPKFDKYLKLRTRIEFVLEIASAAKFIEIRHRVAICRDSDDDMYLELALSGKADCIITGDPDLQVLNPFENVPIILPKDFLERF